jgi:hypothetical protein
VNRLIALQAHTLMLQAGFVYVPFSITTESVTCTLKTSEFFCTESQLKILYVTLILPKFPLLEIFQLQIQLEHDYFQVVFGYWNYASNMISNRPYSKVNKSRRAKVSVIFSLPI